MRKVVVGVIAVVLVAIVAYMVVRRHRGPAAGTAAGSAASGGAAIRAAEQPSLGNAIDPKDPAVAKFLQRKADGVAHLTADLEARMHMCEAAGAGSSSGTPAEPRTVAVTLDWDEHLSTPELQRYVVGDLRVVGADKPVAAESLRCLDRLKGATLNVLIAVGETPRQQLHLEELIALPLR